MLGSQPRSADAFATVAVICGTTYAEPKEQLSCPAGMWTGICGFYGKTGGKSYKIQNIRHICWNSGVLYDRITVIYDGCAVGCMTLSALRRILTAR